MDISLKNSPYRYLFSHKIDNLIIANKIDESSSWFTLKIHFEDTTTKAFQRPKKALMNRWPHVLLNAIEAAAEESE